MLLCPDGHENPQILMRCRVCSLPLIELRKEFSGISARLADKAVLARHKPKNILIGVGSVGASLIQNDQVGLAPGTEFRSSMLVDAELPASSGEQNGVLRLRIGGSIAGSSTFAGVAEAEAEETLSLVPMLRNVGLREPDDEQTVFAVAALGGGTGGGVTPVIMRNVLEQNPKTRSMVLALLPPGEDSFHAHLNAYYGVSRFLTSGIWPLTDAIIPVQYDRLKRARGVGQGGAELKLERLLSSFLGLLTSTLSFPNSARLARLNRSAHTLILAPCLAMGRSIEIFGTLGNVLESAMAFPLACISEHEVLSCYLLLRVPRRMADLFAENAVSEQLAEVIRRHFPRVRASTFFTAYSDDSSDRVDACLLLGDDSSRVFHSTTKGHQQFNAHLSRIKDWSLYGLTGERVETARRAMEEYDARLQEMRRE